MTNEIEVTKLTRTNVSVAVVGAGPAGLATAITLGELLRPVAYRG